MNIDIPYARLVNNNCDQQIDHFERLFYYSFNKSENQTLIRKLWIFDDDSQRLKTKVTYNDQYIVAFVSSTHEDVGYVAFNHALNLLQSNSFGFSLPDFFFSFLLKSLLIG